MKVPFVDLKAQYITIKHQIDSAIEDCIENSAFIQGKRVQAFEDAFAAYLHVRRVVGCGNGTDALFLALKAVGVGPGDEVITAANSFIATAEAVTMTGAKVVFADVHDRTNNMTPETVEPRITSKTKVILPVHLYGYPADLSEIRELADRHKLIVVADAAQAHGAEIEGNSVAGMADITAYSFFPGKNLGAFGDAGGIATNDSGVAEYISKFRNHGRLDKYKHDFEGVNMRMDEIQGAVLGVKLCYLAGWTEARRSHAAYYTERLACIGDLELPSEAPDVKAVYHLYVVETAGRDALQNFLRENGIATGIHYPVPLPLQPAYAHLKMTEMDFPIACRKAQRILSLPMFPEMKREQQDYVIGKINDFFRI